MIIHSDMKAAAIIIQKIDDGLHINTDSVAKIIAESRDSTECPECPECRKWWRVAFKLYSVATEAKGAYKVLKSSGIFKALPGFKHCVEKLNAATFEAKELGL